MGFSTDISTGSDTSGISALVTTGDDLTAQAVAIRDLAGFTGTYNAGLGEPDAEVTMIGSTFVITGTATGFRTDALLHRDENSPCASPADLSQRAKISLKRCLSL
jgi:hypothetical protein